jgi:hypothetical protein
VLIYNHAVRATSEKGTPIASRLEGALSGSEYALTTNTGGGALNPVYNLDGTTEFLVGNVSLATSSIATGFTAVPPALTDGTWTYGGGAGTAAVLTYNATRTLFELNGGVIDPTDTRGEAGWGPVISSIVQLSPRVVRIHELEFLYYDMQSPDCDPGETEITLYLDVELNGLGTINRLNVSLLPIFLEPPIAGERYIGPYPFCVATATIEFALSLIGNDLDVTMYSGDIASNTVVLSVPDLHPILLTAPNGGSQPLLDDIRDLTGTVPYHWDLTIDSPSSEDLADYSCVMMWHEDGAAMPDSSVDYGDALADYVAGGGIFVGGYRAHGGAFDAELGGWTGLGGAIDSAAYLPVTIGGSSCSAVLRAYDAGSGTSDYFVDVASLETTCVSDFTLRGPGSLQDGTFTYTGIGSVTVPALAYRSDGAVVYVNLTPVHSNPALSATGDVATIIANACQAPRVP